MSVTPQQMDELQQALYDAAMDNIDLSHDSEYEVGEGEYPAPARKSHAQAALALIQALVTTKAAAANAKRRP